MYAQQEIIEMLLVSAGIVIGMVLILSIVATFLEAIARVLRRVSPENRRMTPGQVFLNLIPFFNIIWITVTVERVAESLRSEFRERAMDGPGEDYGRRNGVPMVTMLVFSLFIYPAFVTLPAALMFGYVYWRDMNRYRARLKPGAYAPPPTDEGW